MCTLVCDEEVKTLEMIRPATPHDSMLTAVSQRSKWLHSIDGAAFGLEMRTATGEHETNLLPLTGAAEPLLMKLKAQAQYKNLFPSKRAELAENDPDAEGDAAADGENEDNKIDDAETPLQSPRTMTLPLGFLILLNVFSRNLTSHRAARINANVVAMAELLLDRNDGEDVPLALLVPVKERICCCCCCCCCCEGMT